ncbi:MAG: DNA-deoxyinosine glycosylase [Clostridia bacterium]|nr:DNA-deoxyinosine glycosylase [Clostridia bacterium]
MTERAEGFAPFYEGKCRVLILGSFPSVKSRATGFYYGNPQNRFWRTVCGFFGEEAPPDNEGKKAFLKRRNIALWDVVLSCEIEGSSDASIRAEEVAKLDEVFADCGAQAILCNGKKAYGVLEREYPALLPVTQLMPSTSPANPRFSAEVWEEALRRIYK